MNTPKTMTEHTDVAKWKYAWYKKLITGFLVLALSFGLGVGVMQTNAAGNVKLNKTKVSLKVGQTVKLKVCGTRKKVYWISKNKSVATVSAIGKVRAKKAGTARVVAKVSGRRYTCKVTVVRKKPISQDAKKPSAGNAELAPRPTSAPIPTSKPILTPKPVPTPEPEPSRKTYTFRSESLLEEHYQKHGVEMGFAAKEDYVAAANAVIFSPNALHKLEAEDGDDVYYLEATNEFVIVSTDGYIRTYFCPEDGKEYFERQ